MANGNGNLELALRIRADLDQAIGAMREIDGSLSKLRKTADGTTTALGKQEQQVDDLLRSYDPASAALKKLARDEAALKKAVDKGRISREQYNRAMQRVGSSRAQWQGVQAGVDKTTQSLGRARVSLGNLAGDLARGDVTGATNNLAAGAGRAALGFGALGIAVAGTVGVLALFGLAAVQGYRDSQALDQALIATGHSAGVTGGQLGDMRNRIGAASGEFGKAQDALLLLAQSGTATGDSLEAAATAAVNLSELTGRSIADTVREVQSLAESPSEAVRKLNEQYHFLTLEVYQQIRALEEQGRTQDATALATDELARVTDQRTAEMRANAGTLERAWLSVRAAVLETIQALKDVGNEDPEARVRVAEAALARLRSPDAIGGRGNNVLSTAARAQLIRDAEWRLRLAQLAADAAERAADAEGERQAVQDQGIDAAAAIAGELERGASRADQMSAAVKRLKDNFIALRAAAKAGGDQDPLLAGVNFGADGSISGGAFDRRLQQIRKDFEERSTGGGSGSSSGGNARASALASESRALANYVAQLERQAQVYGLTRQEALAYEIAERGLTGTLKQRAEAAAALLAQREEDDAIARDAELLEQVQVQYLKAIGQASAAAELELEARYADLLKRLEERADAAGIALVEGMFNVEKARIALDGIQSEMDRASQDIVRAEQRINIDRENGLISSIEAQKRLLDLRRQEIGVLQLQLQMLESIADKTPETLSQIADLKLQLYELQQQGSLLETTFRNSFEGGLATALEGLATRTLTLRDALTGLLRDVAGGLARLAAQQLASLATSKLMGLFNKGGKTPDLQAPDPAQAGAAGAAYALPIGLAASALGASAIPLTAAAAALSASAAALAAAGAGGGGSTGGGFNWASLLSLFGGFADGGHVRGAGTGSSDSIAARLSDYEFVTRAAVVRQPGALAFMTDFNRYGMRTLDGLANRYAHAPKIHGPAPVRSRFAEGGLARAGSGNPVVNNRFRFVNVLDIQDIARRVAATSVFETEVVNKVVANSTAVREGLAQ